MKAEHRRDKFVTVRLSEAEFAELGRLAKRAKGGIGVTRSAYLRAAALNEREWPGEEIRALRNTVIKLDVGNSPKATEAKIRALDTISRLRLK